MLQENSYNSSKVSEYKMHQNQPQNNFEEPLVKLNSNHEKYQQFKKSFNVKDFTKSNKSNKSDENQEPFQLKKQSKIRYVQSPIVNRYTSTNNAFYQKNLNQPVIMNRKSSKQFCSQSKSNFYSPNNSNSRSPYKIFQRQKDQNSERKSIQQKINQCAANELIWQTQKQMMQTIIDRQKQQLKDYEKKAEEYWKQKQTLMRLKSRNQILQREYQILKEQNQRLKSESGKATNNLYSFEGTKTSKYGSLPNNNWQVANHYLNTNTNNINNDLNINNNNRFTSPYQKQNNQLKQLKQLKLKRTDSILNNTKTGNTNNTNQNNINFITQLQINRLKQQINQLKQNLNHQKEQKLIQCKKVSQIQLLLEKLQSQSKLMKIKYEDKEQIIKKLENDKEKYMNNYKVIKKERQKEKTKDQEKLKEIQIVKKQLQNRQLKLQSIRQQMQLLKNRFKNKEIQLQDREEQILKLKRDCTRLKSNIQDLSQGPQIIKNNYLEQIKINNVQLDQIRKKYGLLKDQNSLLEQQILKIKKQNKNITIKLCETQTLLEKLQIQHLNLTEKFKETHLKTVSFQTNQQEAQNKLAFITDQFQKKKIQLSQNWIYKFNEQRKLFDKQKNQFQLILQGKQGEVIKLRKQIEDLLKQLIKYRSCAQRQKKLQMLMKYQMNINQTVQHLWSIKQVQYLKVNKILQNIQNTKQQQLIADRNLVNTNKLQTVRESVNEVVQSEVDELRSNEMYLKQKQRQKQKQKSN